MSRKLRFLSLKQDISLGSVKAPWPRRVLHTHTHSQASVLKNPDMPTHSYLFTPTRGHTHTLTVKFIPQTCTHTHADSHTGTYRKCSEAHGHTDTLLSHRCTRFQSITQEHGHTHAHRPADTDARVPPGQHVRHACGEKLPTHTNLLMDTP